MDLSYLRNQFRTYTDLFQSIYGVRVKSPFTCEYPILNKFIHESMEQMDVLFGAMLNEGAADNLENTLSLYKSMIELFMVTQFLVEQTKADQNEEVAHEFVKRNITDRLLESVLGGRGRLDEWKHLPAPYDPAMITGSLFALYPPKEKGELNRLLKDILSEWLSIVPFTSLDPMLSLEPAESNEFMLKQKIPSMVSNGFLMTTIVKEHLLQTYKMDMEDAFVMSMLHTLRGRPFLV